MHISQYFIVHISYSYVSFQGNVETWLGEVLKQTRLSIHSVIRSAALTIGDQSFNLLEFENSYPAQVDALKFMTV